MNSKEIENYLQVEYGDHSNCIKFPDNYKRHKSDMLQEIAFQLAVANEQRETQTQMAASLQKSLDAKVAAPIADHQWNIETIKQTPTDTLRQLHYAIVGELAGRKDFDADTQPTSQAEAEARGIESLCTREWGHVPPCNGLERMAKDGEKCWRSVATEVVEKLSDWPIHCAHFKQIGAEHCEDCAKADFNYEPEKTGPVMELPPLPFAVPRATRLNVFALANHFATQFPDYSSDTSMYPDELRSELKIILPAAAMTKEVGDFFAQCSLIPIGYKVFIEQKKSEPELENLNWLNSLDCELQRVWRGSGYANIMADVEKRTLIVGVHPPFYTSNTGSIKRFVDNLKPMGWLVEVRTVGH